MGCADIKILSPSDKKWIYLKTTKKKEIIIETTKWPPQPPTWPWQRTTEPSWKQPLQQNDDFIIQKELLQVPIYVDRNNQKLNDSEQEILKNPENQLLNRLTEITTNPTSVQSISISSIQTVIPENWPPQVPTWP